MEIYRSVVIEDVQVAREGLVQLLRKYPNIEIVGQASGLIEAKEALSELKPGLVFMDVQIPGGTAFDALSGLQQSPLIIFTTAYSEYALQAFDLPVVDYLLKPINFDKLDRAIGRLQNYIGKNVQESEKDVCPLLINSKILIRCDDEDLVVDLCDIDLFESCKNHTQIYFRGKKSFIHKALSHIEMRLPAQYFFRINRSQIINMESIVKVQRASSSCYEVDIGATEKLEVSRRQTALLKELMSL